MQGFMTVQTADGRSWKIMVLDTFEVSEFPGKEYIAYTFGEEVDTDSIKSYISVLTETDNYYSLEAMTSSEENAIVKEAYMNMLLESGV